MKSYSNYLFELLFCTAVVRISSYSTTIHITGPFSYSRLIALPPNTPLISPCASTIITNYDLPKPLRPIAPCGFDTSVAHPQALSLAA